MPQVSILGHLLFLKDVNDIPQALKLNMFLYADDSCFVSQGKIVKEIKKTLNGDFTSTCE